MTDFTTSYPYPWALVRRGGLNGITGTPMTRMAFIKDVRVDGGEIALYRALIGNERLEGWTKHARDVAPAEIVRMWRSRPSASEIRKSKAYAKRIAKIGSRP